MKRYLLICVFAVSASYIYAQSCAQKLSQFERNYEEGKLLDIPKGIEDLLSGKSCALTKEEEIRARALLTKTHIFRDEEAEADKAIRGLLKVDPEHVLDRQSDPRELFFLMDQFRTDPIIRAAIRFSVNAASVNVIEEHGTTSTGTGEGMPDDLPKFYNGKNSNGDDSYNLDRFDEDFNAVSGVATGFGIELMGERHIMNGIEVGVGAEYRLSQYNVDSFLEPSIITSVTNRQSFFRVPLLLRYTLWYDNHNHKIKPYVYLGGSPNFLLSATYVNATRNGGTAFSLAENNDLEEFDMVNTTDFSIFGGLGVKIRIKTHYLTVELRYDNALNNYINARERHANTSSNFDLAFVEDDLSLNVMSISVGWAHSIYSPKKLKEKKR